MSDTQAWSRMADAISEPWAVPCPQCEAVQWGACDRHEPHLGRSVDALIAAGFGDVARLRVRVHEAVDECQRRYAPQVSRLAHLENLEKSARAHYERHGGEAWAYQSANLRAYVCGLIAERDELRAENARLTTVAEKLLAAADRVTAERDALAAKVAAVEPLHHEVGCETATFTSCGTCPQEWPCDTAKALAVIERTGQEPT